MKKVFLLLPATVMMILLIESWAAYTVGLPVSMTVSLLLFTVPMVTMAAGFIVGVAICELRHR